MDEGYLDVKFGELRRAYLAGVAAMLFLSYLRAEPPTAPEARINELKTRAVSDAVDLYFRV